MEESQRESYPFIGGANIPLCGIACGWPFVTQALGFCAAAAEKGGTPLQNVVQDTGLKTAKMTKPHG